jgi:hypothetical protein
MKESSRRRRVLRLYPLATICMVILTISDTKFPRSMMASWARWANPVSVPYLACVAMKESKCGKRWTEPIVPAAAIFSRLSNRIVRMPWRETVTSMSSTSIRPGEQHSNLASNSVLTGSYKRLIA